MNKRLAAAGLAAGLVGGAAAGLAIGIPGLATAQSTTTTPPTTVAGTPPTTGSTTKPADRSQHLRDVLAPLVKDGTLTQAQADAVVAAIDAARPADGGRGGHGPGGRGPGGHFGVRGSLDAAATAIGITEAELRTALQGGATIAEVAKDKGIELQKVIDAMVADIKAHLDQAVKDGKLTQAQADERLATVAEQVTKAVNGELPMKGDRGPRPAVGSAPTTTTS